MAYFFCSLTKRLGSYSSCSWKIDLLDMPFFTPPRGLGVDYFFTAHVFVRSMVKVDW